MAAFPRGSGDAVHRRVAGITRFEEIIAWQLCSELKAQVLGFARRPALRRDMDLCRQLRKSSRASPALIAEGFGRFRPREFARFVEMAIASEDETRNHLRDAAEAGHITVEEFRSAWHIAYRARRAASAFHAYLRNCDPPPNGNNPPPPHRGHPPRHRRKRRKR